MKANIGNIDKMVRIAVAAVISILVFTKIISGMVAIIALIIGIILLLTTLINFCPIWHLLGISTLRNKIKNKN